LVDVKHFAGALKGRKIHGHEMQPILGGGLGDWLRSSIVPPFQGSDFV